MKPSRVSYWKNWAFERGPQFKNNEDPKDLHGQPPQKGTELCLFPHNVGRKKRNQEELPHAPVGMIHGIHPPATGETEDNAQLGNKTWIVTLLC